MVKFGKNLTQEKVPRWSDGYVDYDSLKKILGEMINTGSIREFNEDVLYLAHSVATTDEVIRPPGAREGDFIARIDAEIEKVNRWTAKIHMELETLVEKISKAHSNWVQSGRPKTAQADTVLEEVESAEAELQAFENFINMNYLAFSKILKKHDKYSTCPLRMPYLMKVQSQTFVLDKMGSLVRTLSDLRASLQGAAVSAGKGAFDAAQKGGASFVRKTTKYWVQTKDVLKVKMFILKHRPVYKFTDGPSDSDLVTSIYYDNDKLELYQGRLKKYDGAIAFRIRWYGPEESFKTAFMERKTHREDWYGDGEASAKERFPLPPDKVVPFLQGKLSPADVRSILASTGFKGDLDEAQQLAAEMQAAVLSKKLRPSVRTHYMRTAFQRTGDATVRCSLDTELCMALEPCGDGEWKRMGPLDNRSQVTQFPHGVLEVKLQLISGTAMPEWVSDLLNSGCLREMPKFSKFVHGTAMLKRDQVRELPYWWSAQFMPLWAGANFVEQPTSVPFRMVSKDDKLRTKGTEAPLGTLPVSQKGGFGRLLYTIFTCNSSREPAYY
ncbi:hypothetical protein EMIHUDRAFT_438229 [Emiliania huxleyi CCMP1516]|uniref:SPX domain-containing protein n=3 Tax=Emiliania huxleyi TaxID=2903 RepID=A0A0D3IC26_EMIH1|nr:hypothetical protein EMIHUDRAFT_438229 [Emiliania huxleyi CCMP1516]EOD08811.1 hypothetical protein EMIHUDRAFT_438229 [Emiliania huxleyi CCMP1516]|mmetsp:Transcript_9900/g.32503  ORF Transcript_9900/g.32503 Transcript_9900/m.32503 type:complete len:554 (+) Transcript_9900:125-1786(+)|eukprot:XP_005761240.1 hypothetical protein EMIHUDRAFT_438229 [Emiliania huxleyi CCMP1516]